MFGSKVGYASPFSCRIWNSDNVSSFNLVFLDLENGHAVFKLVFLFLEDNAGSIRNFESEGPS